MGQNNLHYWLQKYGNQPGYGGNSTFFWTQSFMACSMSMRDNLMMNLTDADIFNITNDLFGTPDQWITGLWWYPFNIPLDSQGTPYKLQLGRVTLKSSYPVICYYTSEGDPNVSGYPSQQALIELGSYFVEEHFHDFKDYNTYTEIRVYLPFHGYVDLATNDVMNKQLYFYIQMDYHTGQGIYYIAVGPKDCPLEEQRILTTVTVQLGYRFSLGGQQAFNAERNLVMGGLKIAAAIATKGMTSAVSTTSETQTSVEKVRNEETGRQITKGSSSSTRTLETRTRHEGYEVPEFINGSLQAIDNAFSNGHAESVNNTILGLSGPRHIKVVIRRCIPDYPENYTHYFGKPYNAKGVLSSVNGFTKISNIHLQNIGSATSNELSEIVETLKSGVII